MANSLLTYVKENPWETALTVASVIPAVRVASLLHKAHKAYKARPVTIYRGIPNKKLSLKDAKQALALSKYGFKNEPKGKLTKGFGNWFTTDIFQATRKIKQGGTLLKTKVDLKTLQKIKDQQPSHRTSIKTFNLQDRNFFGIVPSSIRRKAERKLVKKVEHDIAGRVKIK